MKWYELTYLIVTAAMSLVTFAAYGWDKRQSARGGRRIAEARLHTLALLGGWPGALLGRRFWRHKTQKLGFLAISWLIGLAHVLMVMWYVRR